MIVLITFGAHINGIFTLAAVGIAFTGTEAGVAFVFITGNGIAAYTNAILAGVGLGTGVLVVTSNSVEVGVNAGTIDTIAIVAFTNGS